MQWSVMAEMQSGPELDAAVAAALGEERSDCVSSGVGGGGAFTGDDGKPVVEGWWFCKQCGGIVYDDETRKCSAWPYFQYSKDIAAAWQVVERMESLGYEFTLTTYALPAPWCAIFFKEGNDYDGFGDKAPHAISLAALAAMEAK